MTEGGFYHLGSEALSSVVSVSEMEKPRLRDVGDLQSGLGFHVQRNFNPPPQSGVPELAQSINLLLFQSSYLK